MLIRPTDGVTQNRLVSVLARHSWTSILQNIVLLLKHVYPAVHAEDLIGVITHTIPADCFDNVPGLMGETRNPWFPYFPSASCVLLLPYSLLLYSLTTLTSKYWSCVTFMTLGIFQYGAVRQNHDDCQWDAVEVVHQVTECIHLLSPLLLLIYCSILRLMGQKLTKWASEKSLLLWWLCCGFFMRSLILLPATHPTAWCSFETYCLISFAILA